MSSTEIEKNLYFATHAGEDPERAAMPFVLANAALALDIQAVVCLQGNGVHLAQKGYTEKMRHPGAFTSLSELINTFTELGGKLLVCGPCLKERNIDEKSDLIDGAEITAAGALNLLAMECKAVFVY